jgi:hypothetical protein
MGSGQLIGIEWFARGGRTAFKLFAIPGSLSNLERTLPEMASLGLGSPFSDGRLLRPSLGWSEAS